jgi:predicted DNA-binding protein
MSNSQPNLDRLAAEHAQEIIRRTSGKKASDVDNTITKSLGVLQENGVYACFLYLLAKEEKEKRDVVVEEMLSLLDGLSFGWGRPVNNGAEAVLKHITEKVTDDLERLLLAKETLEQMLIYARYGAKARD